MIPLGMIMGQVLADYMVERPFAQHHHLLQGLLLDGAHEPFAMGVEIWTPWGQDDWFYPAIPQQVVKRLGVFRVTVMDEIPFAQQEPFKRIGQLPGALLHEGVCGMRGHASNLYAPG